jgi:methylglutaconyl-CoA hydratase
VTLLDQAFRDFHQERNVRGIILTGVGDVFCAGTDLVQLQETANSKDAMQQWHEDVNSFRTLVELMLRYPKPIVCAANGPIVGSGLTLLLSSDLVVASETASISLPESLRGLSPAI